MISITSLNPALKEKVDWLLENQKEILNFLNTLNKDSVDKISKMFSIEQILSKIEAINNHLITDLDKKKFRGALDNIQDLTSFSDKLRNSLENSYRKLVNHYTILFEKNYNSIKEKMENLEDIKDYFERLEDVKEFAHSLFHLYKHPCYKIFAEGTIPDKIGGTLVTIVEYYKWINLLNDKYQSIKELTEETISSYFHSYSNPEFDSILQDVLDFVNELIDDSRNLLDYPMYKRALDFKYTLKMLMNNKQPVASFKSYFEDYESINSMYHSLILTDNKRLNSQQLSELKALNKLLADMDYFLTHPAKTKTLMPSLLKKSIKETAKSIQSEVSDEFNKIEDKQRQGLEYLLDETMKYSGNLDADLSLSNIDLEIYSKLKPMVNEFLHSTKHSKNYRKNLNILYKLENYQKIARAKSDLTSKAQEHLREVKDALVVFKKEVDTLSQERDKINIEKLIFNLDLFEQREEKALTKFRPYLKDEITSALDFVATYRKHLRALDLKKSKPPVKPYVRVHETTAHKTLVTHKKTYNSLQESPSKWNKNSRDKLTLEPRNILSMLSSTDCEDLYSRLKLVEASRRSFNSEETNKLLEQLHNLSSKFSAFHEEIYKTSSHINR